MMRAALVVVALVTASSLPAQFAARAETLPRQMTRIVWNGMSGEQRLSIDYGPARWRPEYEAIVVGAGAARHVVLGKGAWTTLQSSVDLRFGEKRVPRGRWYLGVHRDEAGAWALTLMAADKVDAEGVYLGGALATQTDVRVPMRLEQDATRVEDLTIALAVDSKAKQNVALSLVWGTHRLCLDFVAEVDDRESPGVPAFAPTPKAKLVMTASGLGYEQLQAGAGRRPTPTDRVSVHYTGWLDDGTIFDSSYWGGQPVTFPLQAVVKGFGEGLQLMQPGAVFQFTIPPDLAYGERGAGQLVPPNATLVFQVTLLAIVD